MKKIYYILISIVLVALIVLSIKFVLSSKPEELEYSPPVSNVVRVLIDPGHSARYPGGVGPIGLEHEYAYKVSDYLAKILDKDPRFRYELSRYPAESEYYNDDIIEYSIYNENKLFGITTTKIPREKRGYLADEQYVDMYAIRHYAIDNNFDCLISIHFDVANKRYYDQVHGFHVLISPYNRQFERSYDLANAISSNFMKEYGVARGVRHDATLNANHEIWKEYDRLGLLAHGIGFRSLVIIGDVFENEYYMNRYNHDTNFVQNILDIPSVLVEVGYLHEEKFTNEYVLQDVAQRIYTSIQDTFPEWTVR